MEYPYPREFPQESRKLVLAQIIRAARTFEDKRKVLDSSETEGLLLEYILSVFITFVREAAKLGRRGVWTTDKIRSQSLEFLRQFAITARSQKGYDRSGNRLGALVSHWDGSLLPEVQRAFEQSPEWREFEEILLELPDAAPRVGNGESRLGPGIAEQAITEIEALDWGDVEISFISDERVQLKRKGQLQTCNYTEMGCQDKRSNKPNQAWRLLRTLAQAGGTIPPMTRNSRDFVALGKGIERLRRTLKDYFRIPGDPIPFDSTSGYHCRFKIACAPSFEK